MIAVIQFREASDPSRQHERDCILRRTDQPDSLRFLSVFEDAVQLQDPRRLLQGFDKVIMGGNAAIQVLLQDDPSYDHQKGMYVLQTITPFARYILDNDVPTLATCFGHQLFAYLLGVDIIRDAQQAEVGSFEVSLTPEGRADRLFDGVPMAFSAILGHNLSIAALPPGATVLASSERHPFQAFRYGGNVYSTQFHSELDDRDLAVRLALFPSYRANATEASLAVPPSPHSVAPLRNFIAFPSNSSMRVQ